jgi:hypothetical protein
MTASMLLDVADTVMVLPSTHRDRDEDYTTTSQGGGQRDSTHVSMHNRRGTAVTPAGCGLCETAAQLIYALLCNSTTSLAQHSTAQRAAAGAPWLRAPGRMCR